MEFLHPAMWHVALESWQWICPVAAPCSVAGGTGMTCRWIRQTFRHIGILLLVSISAMSSQSTCHSAPSRKILYKSNHLRQKKNDVMSIVKMTDLCHLGFWGPIMGSLKNPCTTSYRSSIETMALNCLVFEKIALCFLVTDRQTDRQTDVQAHCIKPLWLSREAA